MRQHPTGTPVFESQPRPFYGNGDLRPLCREHPLGRFVQRLPGSLPDAPCGGDVVRLVAPWSFCKAGEVGIIEGKVGEARDDASITFRFSAHVAEEGYVTASGGPGTVWTDMRRLKPTGEVLVVTCWRWRDGRAAAHNGVDFLREARVWEWDGRSV